MTKYVAWVKTLRGSWDLIPIKAENLEGAKREADELSKLNRGKEVLMTSRVQYNTQLRPSLPRRKEQRERAKSVKVSAHRRKGSMGVRAHIRSRPRR